MYFRDIETLIEKTKEQRDKSMKEKSENRRMNGLFNFLNFFGKSTPKNCRKSPNQPPKFPSVTENFQTTSAAFFISVRRQSRLHQR